MSIYLSMSLSPYLSDTIRNINKAKFDDLIGVKGAPMPSTFKTYDEYKVPFLPPHEAKYNWNVNLDYMEQKGLIKHYLPPQPVRPGGVSMKEFARTWVDRGDWPLVVGFGLGYR